MQHEGELRSDIDYLIDILRANPKTKFTISKLQSLTGHSNLFLKKWINVLEEQGHIRFFYNISNEEFAWISNETHEHLRHRENTVINSARIPKTNGRQEYSQDEMRILLEDVKKSFASAKEVHKKFSKLKNSKFTDLAALGLAQHTLEEKKNELLHLLSEAKRLKN